MLDSPGLRVAFDIGGTFTDVIIASETQISRFKILTLPASVGADVHECIEGVVRANPGISVESLVHGTTVAANTVLALSGALATAYACRCRAGRCQSKCGHGRR